MFKRGLIVLFPVFALLVIQLAVAEEKKSKPGNAATKKIDEKAGEEVHEISIPLDDICQQVRQLKTKLSVNTSPVSSDSICQNAVPTDPSPAITQLWDYLGLMQDCEIRSDALALCDQVEHFGLVAGNPGQEPPSIEIKDQNNTRWRFKFFFGNSKTYYNKTDITVKTSRLDLKLSGVQPYERRSDSYITNFFHESPQAMAQVVDEPTNTFTFVLAKDKNEIFLKIFHPKFVFVEGNQEFNGHGDYNNNVLVQGTADGQTINGKMPLKGGFTPDHNLEPGRVGFVSWEESHKLLQPEIGYGREITLIKSQGQPIVRYTPQVSVGVYLGVKNAVYIGKSHYQYDYQSYSDGSDSNAGVTVQGYSAAISQRLDVNNRKDNVGVFVEHKFSYGEMKYDFLDGTAKHDISYNSFTIGLSLAIRPQKTLHDISSHLKRRKSEAPAVPQPALTSDEDAPATQK